ncbi:major facilitator superfamily domain-containing protein [Xylogone sp. PMI_703]|nr:major facilitator superfamily domain-containing protein [Xylogone sp. PMI_703]
MIFVSLKLNSCCGNLIKGTSTHYITVFGYARTAGLASHLELSQGESEETYTDTKFVLLAFAWLLSIWHTANVRKLILITISIQSTLVLAQIFSPSAWFLLLVRSLLGIGGAVFPGALLLLCRISPSDLTLAVAVFVAITPFQISVIGPLMAVVVNFLKDTLGLNWRGIFAIDGILGILIGLALWLRLPNVPDSILLHSRFREPNDERTWKRGIVRIFNMKNLLCVAIYVCPNLAAASAPSYLGLQSHTSFAYVPYYFFTVFADLSSSHIGFHILMMAPYLIALFSIFITVKASAKTKVRGYYASFYMFLSCLGFALMSIAASFGWSELWFYFAIFLTCIGCYCAITVIISWALGNVDSEYERALLLTELLVAGQLATIFSPAGIKPYWRAIDEPNHPRGLGLCAAIMAFGGFLALVLRAYLATRNRQAERHSYLPVGSITSLENEPEDQIDCKYVV